MPINPFQTTAEMSWGGYSTQKQNAGVVGGRLGGGIEKGYASRANMQAPTENTLKPTPKAGGNMPQGYANIRRPDYGSQQQPQRNGRLASFGGMGAGATKGGGSGMTAGGNISFDLSQDNSTGKTTVGDNATVSGAIGQKAKVSDSLTGYSDSSVTDKSKRTLNVESGSSTTTSRTPRTPRTTTPKTTTPKTTTKRTAASKAPDTEASAPSSRSTSRTRSTSGPASVRDIGEGFMSGGSTLTAAPVNVGRQRFDSDNISRRNKTTTTDVRASGSGTTASADSKDARKVTPAKPKDAKKPATETAVTSPATKEDPKAEATGKETVKEKAKKAVAKSATKVATKATASATKDKKVRAVKTASKTKEEEEE